MAERSSGVVLTGKLASVTVMRILTCIFTLSAKSATSSFGKGSWAKLFLPLYICACLLNCWTLAISRPPITHLRFLEEPQDVVAVKETATLLHCSAHHPDKSPEIEWLKDGEYINFKAENRRYLLPNGSLYFNPVHHSKGLDSDRGRYQCVASVTGLGSIISRVAELRIAHLARSFKQEPMQFNPALYLGDVAMLRCDIEATPTADIAWFRDGDKLQELFDEKGEKQLRYMYQDGVLEITKMEFADFGTYQCEATNIDRSRKSRSIEVQQNPNIAKYQGVLPHFVMKPTDTRGILGENVFLYCGANGRDRKEQRPTITWLKDGTTIDTNNTERFDVIGQGTLRILKVREEDAGTYTCRASNLEDSIDADALLHILVKPKITKPPKDVYANIKMDVTFDCDVYGIPAPTVIWLKDGDKIVPSKYFQITDRKGLRIEGLVDSDEGIYQCFAENSLGTIQASAQLVILKSDLPLPQAISMTTKPILPGELTVNDADRPPPPRNLQAALISHGFVTLLWKQPETLLSGTVTKYSVFWKEKGSNRERLMNTTTIEANIQHLKPDTIYEFRVISYNNVAPSKEAATLSVRTEPEVFVPSPATNVRATTLSSTSIRVEWDPPQQENGNVIQYELIYYEVGEVGEHEVTVDGYSKTLTGLEAFTEYSFRVVAHNQNGPGMSTEEFVARTYSDRPSAEPQNVTLEVASTTSIIVRWEPPEKEHQNGLINGYKIRYKKRGGESQIATPDKNRRAYSLTGLDRNSEYLVRLTALTVNGSGPATDWLSASTLQDDLDESRVPGPPTNLRLQPFSNSIIVRWDPPAETGVAIKGYYLGYGKGIPDVYVQVLDARQLHYRIENLLPSVEYVISLKAFNDKGHGFKKLEAVTTREELSKSPEPATPMIPPVGLKATVLSAKTIVLTWTDSTLGKNQRITDARYYTIRYTSIPNKNSRYRYSNSTDCNIHIDDLKPNTQYEFSVKVIKGRRQSTWSLNVFNTTFESAPGSVARDLTPVPVEGNPMAVTLNWQPPQRPNGQITGYLVFYTTDNSQRDRDWVVEGVLGDVLSTTINDLTPDTTYYFKVQARNSKGYGPTSPTVIYRTPKADGTGGGRVETPNLPDVLHVPGASLDTKVYDTSLARRPNYIPSGDPDAEEGKGKKEKSEEKGISNNVLIIIIACVVGVTFCVIIFVVTLVFCRRRTNNINRNQRNKGAYKSPNKGPVKDVKPPDLWIHHDHLELKNMQKPPGGEPSMTVTPIPRNSQEIKHPADDMQHNHNMDTRRNSFVGSDPPSYEPRQDDRYQRPITVRPKPIMLPVDSQHPPREPVATVTAMPNGHMMQMVDPQQGVPPMRPVYPRTQYNTQYSSTPRVHAGDVSQPSSIYGTDDEDTEPLASDPLLEDRTPQYRSRIGYDPHTPEMKPFHHRDPHSSSEQLHHNHPRSPSPNSATSGALSSTDQEDNGSLSRRIVKRNPLKSFKVPGPPSGVVSPRPKHIVKPQQPVNSPYKRPNPPISSAPIKPRVPIVHRAPDVVLKPKPKEDSERQKSLSTEELTAEMANLEGLMKDLNAITQQEFQC